MSNMQTSAGLEEVNPDHETIRDPSMATVSKSQFARTIGVSAGRVSQMIADGLPVEANGKIDVARGRMWYADNVEGRGRSQGALFDTGLKVKLQRDLSDARLRGMKADVMAGTLIDRAAAERAIFGRARADRDAWLTWPVDAAATIAADIHVDEATLLPVLRRLVEDHLAQLAEGPDVRLS